jgi:hypothetical protein
MDEKPTIFIAHSNIDVIFARIIRNCFEDLGHDALLLKLSQQMTEGYLKTLLRREILARDWIVIVLSENSRQSNWVAFERSYAKETQKPIFHVELEECIHLKDSKLSNCLKKQVEQIKQEIQVFISYSRHDSEMAGRISRDLRNTGYNTWLDIEKLPSGSNWMEMTLSGLDRSIDTGGLVVLLSEYSVNSEFVMKEFEYAMRNGGRVYPCIISPISSIRNRLPIMLQSIQWIDLTSSYERGISQLLEDLRRRHKTG